jgi:hypothetical protein
MLAVAAWLYRPWAWRPIGIGDVAEYITVVRSAPGFADRFWALTDFYAHHHGRFNPVVFAAISLKWTLFAADAVAWYWLRFAVMGAIVATAYHFLRRLGTSLAGGLAGAALFVYSSPAAEGWTLLSIGEPIGTLFLLWALWLAAAYRTARRWALWAPLIVVCCTLAVLAKEMLVCAVPLVLVVAACHERPGALEPPRRDARTAALLAGCTAAVGAAGVLVLWAARQPRAGFASAYALGNIGPAALGRLAGAVLPLTADAPAELLPVLAANSVFVAVLWRGGRCAVAARPRGGAREAAWLVTGLLTPVLGTALYAPWPTYPNVYSLPMLVGSAVLLGRAVTAIAPRRALGAAVAACAGVGAVGLSLAWRQARRSEAEVRVADAAIRAAMLTPNIASLVFRSADTTARVWSTGAQVWALYARALYGRDLPPATTVACRAALPPDRGAVLTVSSSVGCGALAGAVSTYREYFDYVDWPHFRHARDSVRVDLRRDPATDAGQPSASDHHGA